MAADLFYKVSPRGAPLQGVQLEMFHAEPSELIAASVQRPWDPDRPLLDLIPEAYA